MAVTEQQFIEQYSQMSADKQQKAYNAWNAQVKWWIDNYNATQTSVPQQNVIPKTPVTTNNNNNNGNTVSENDSVTPKNTIPQKWALAPLSQEYYNQSNTESQNTIVSNLNNYRQTNPEYFTDYESFKRNFSYDARNDTQKQTLDTWYNGYQRWMELNSKTVSDLATQYKNWLISDSDLEQLRTANQWKYGEVMQYINKQTILSKYDEENTPSASDNPFQAIIDQYYNNLLTASQTNASSEMFENYKSQMNSPEMTEMSDQLADLDGQIKEYQNELNRIKSDVERRYEWTWASKTKINAIIADESYKIQEAMNTASLQYNTLATKYNNRMTQYQNEFQLQLQEYNLQMQERNMQMNELWFVMDLMNFETNDQKDERARNQRVRQQDYTYWNINSKDEASRRRAIENAVDGVLSEFSGITMMRSREQMVEDIKNLVDGGMSLWEAITKNIREPIMQKDEYTARQASRYGGTQNSYNTFTVWWNTYTVWSDWKVSYTASVNSYEWSGMKWAWLRNNNPWNIKDTWFGNVLWTDSKWFAIFASPEDWFDALVQKIENIQNWWSKTYSANDTLYSFFSKYAPDSDGNNSKAYAESVAKQLWVTANTQVKNLDATKFAAAIAKHDSWYDYSTYWQFRWQANDQNFIQWSIEWVPVTFERSVKNLVPAALQNSDAEREALNTVIKSMYQWWVDETQAALMFMWFDIKNDADKWLASELVNVIRTLPEDTWEWTIKTLSDAINAGQYEKAIKMVENLATKQAQSSEDYISESAVKNIMNLLDNVEWVNTKDAIWVFKWTANKWLNKLWSTEAQKIKSYISQLQVDAKANWISEDLVPQLNDKADVFYAKLKNLNNTSLSRLNNWRAVYSLPELNKNTLNNYTSRVNLYRTWNTSSTSNKTNTPTLKFNLWWTWSVVDAWITVNWISLSSIVNKSK